MEECITMSMVTQRSVECHARWSLLFTTFIRSGGSDVARVYCADAKSVLIVSPLLTKNLLYVMGFLLVCLASGQYTIL